jgi:CheY-like chemotaxis protein
MEAEPLCFLLVEDDDNHAHLVLRSLEKAPFSVRLYRVTSGADALSFLRREEGFEDAPSPDLVLLDLNLPRATGHEVLSAIKEDPLLKMIPVVVMTTSRDEADRAQAYRHHANSYVVKPADYQKFRQIITDISHYWCRCNEPPYLADV